MGFSELCQVLWSLNPVTAHQCFPHDADNETGLGINSFPQHQTADKKPGLSASATSSPFHIPNMFK